MKYRNPGLYRALTDVFGVNAVHVIRAGEPTEFGYNRDPLTERLRMSIREDRRGEEFKLNCPFCGDTKKRLQINNLWGVYDSRTDSKNWWLIQCFNDNNCMGSLENRQKLIAMLKLGKRYQSRVVKTDRAPRKVGGPVEYPGTIWWIKDIIEKLPNHMILEYLRDRFIPPQVAAYYGAGLCLSGGGAAFDGRLVIPVFEGGKLVSWQARAVTEMPGAKYLSATNTTLANHWYNFDTAIRFHTRVIVEGSIDKWGFGGPALGCFNKAISTSKLKALKKADAKLGKRGNFVVMLDPAMNPKDVARGARHHLEAAEELLENAFPKRVFSVRLPYNRHRQPETVEQAKAFLTKYPQGLPSTGFDPGGLPRAYLRRLVEKVGAEKGFKVSWDLLEDAE